MKKKNCRHSKLEKIIDEPITPDLVEDLEKMANDLIEMNTPKRLEEIKKVMKENPQVGLQIIERIIFTTLFLADCTGVKITVMGVDPVIGQMLGLCDDSGYLTSTEKRIRSKSGIIPIRVFGDIEGVCPIVQGKPSLNLC